MRTEWEFRRRVGRRLWELSVDLRCLAVGLGFAWSSGTFFLALPFMLLTGVEGNRQRHTEVEPAPRPMECKSADWLVAVGDGSLPLPSFEWFAQAMHDSICPIEEVGMDFRTYGRRHPNG